MEPDGSYSPDLNTSEETYNEETYNEESQLCAYCSIETNSFTCSKDCHDAYLAGED